MGDGPIGALPLTALEEAVKQLQSAIFMAPKDEAAAAWHIEQALPYFAAALSWGRKAGRKRLPPGGTKGEQRLAMLERGTTIEQIAEIEGLDEDSIRRDINRARRRSGQ